MAASMKMEFAVQMTCRGCVDAITKAFAGLDGLTVLDISLERQHVLVQTSLPSNRVQEVLESTGRRTILLGVGPADFTQLLSLAESIPSVPAAVSIVSGSGEQRGVIRLVQLTPDICLIEGTVTGLVPGPHALCVHEYGDLTDGCNGCGDVYATDAYTDKASKSATQHLARALATEGGVVEFRPARGRVALHDVIGRSVVIHQIDPESSDSSTRVACGIIARSSGLFENSKRICACSGLTLWDEREAVKQSTTQQSAGN